MARGSVEQRALARRRRAVSSFAGLARMSLNLEDLARGRHLDVAHFAFLVFPADFKAAVRPLEGVFELHVGKLFLGRIQKALGQFVERDQLVLRSASATRENARQNNEGKSSHQNSPIVSPPARVDSARNSSLFVEVEINCT